MAFTIDGDLLGARALAATDLSEHGDEALRQAHRWAQRAHAGLDACAVVPAPARGDTSADRWRALDEEVRRVRSALQARLAALTGRGEGEARVWVEAGDPATAIVSRAAFSGCARVAVGSRGLRGLDRLLLGSVAEQVVRFAPCPVLVARRDQGLHRILVGTDFSAPSMPAVEAAANEARWFGVPVTLLHCLEPEVAVPPGVDARELASELLQQLAAQQGMLGDVLVREGRADAEIVRVAGEIGAELIVVATAGRTGLRRFVLGSVAETVVHSARCSVLVVRKPDDFTADWSDHRAAPAPIA